MKNIPPLGPTSTASTQEPPPQALEPARRRLLQAIAERRESTHPTVGDLVAVVGGHPNTTRHHLRVLVDAGLVSEEHVPPSGGRGRPASRYAVTAAGRQVASAAPLGSAAEEYVALAAAFAERLAERDGDPGADARAIGRVWGSGLAVRHADEVAGDGSGAQRVVGLLDRLGFSPEAGHDDPVEGAAAGSGTTVLLRTCPCSTPPGATPRSSARCTSASSPAPWRPTVSRRRGSGWCRSRAREPACSRCPPHWCDERRGPRADE